MKFSVRTLFSLFIALTLWIQMVHPSTARSEGKVSFEYSDAEKFFTKSNGPTPEQLVGKWSQIAFVQNSSFPLNLTEVEEGAPKQLHFEARRQLDREIDFWVLQRNLETEDVLADWSKINLTQKGARFSHQRPIEGQASEGSVSLMCRVLRKHPDRMICALSIQLYKTSKQLEQIASFNRKVIAYVGLEKNVAE